MPRVIVKSSYMTERTHIANYMRYIATREGVEQLKPSVLYRTATIWQRAFVAEHKAEMASLEEYKKFQKVATINTASKLITAYAEQVVNASQEYSEYARAARENEDIDDNRPATEKQICSIEKHLEEAEGLPEYQDYIESKTIGNASALIGMIAEQHPADPFIYMKYIAERPGVEKNGAWDGLFDLSGKANLEAECDRIFNSKSVVWAHIISLRREDAARVGMDYTEAWRKQIAAEAPKMAKLYNMGLTNMHVLGAFHNEGHHPHVHVLVYSDDSGEGVISKKNMKGAGQKMRAMLTNAIFREDLAPIKAQKTQARNEMRQQIQEFKDALYGKDVKISPDIINAMCNLANSLPVLGKKQYAFFPKEVKAQVNDVLRLIVRSDPAIAKLAKTYFNCEHMLIKQYHDDPQVIEDKLAESINRFYEPHTGKYTKSNDSAAMHNSIIRWAYAIREEINTHHWNVPDAKANEKEGVFSGQMPESETQNSSSRVKPEGLPVSLSSDLDEKSNVDMGAKNNLSPEKPEALPVFESSEPVADIKPDVAPYDENQFPEILKDGVDEPAAVPEVHDVASNSNVGYMVLRMLRDVAGIVETHCNNDNTYVKQNAKRGRRFRRQCQQNKNKNVQKEREANYEH